MAVRLGNNEKIYIRWMYEDEGGSAAHFAWLGCETANNLGRAQEAVETSDKSSDWAQFIAGKRSGTVEATAYADNADPRQAELLEKLENGTKVWVLIGQVEYTGDLDDDTILGGDLMRGVISGISDTNDFGAVASRTFNLTVDGEIEHTDEVEQ